MFTLQERYMLIENLSHMVNFNFDEILNSIRKDGIDKEKIQTQMISIQQSFIAIKSLVFNEKSDPDILLEVLLNFQDVKENLTPKYELDLEAIKDKVINS